MGASSSAAAVKESQALHGELLLAEPEVVDNSSSKNNDKMNSNVDDNKKVARFFTAESKHKPGTAHVEPEVANPEAEALSKLKKENPQLLEPFKHFDETAKKLSNDVESEVDDLNDSLLEFDTFFFTQTESKTRRKLGDYLAYNGFVDAAVKKYVKILKDAGISRLSDDILNGVYTPEKLSNKDFTTCVSLRGLMWNYSDSSVKFGERVAKTGFFHYLIEDLKDLQNKSDKEVKLSNIFDSAIGILHNCGKSTSAETRECFRREETVQMLVPFLKNQFANVKLVILLTLSNIINEEENHLLTADDSIFDVIIQMIKLAKKAHDHRYDGFSVCELVAGLKGLARNDLNKKILMEKGCLPLLRDIIVDKYDKEEVLQAIEAVRVLSFSKDNKETIKEDKTLMKTLKDLSHSGKDAIKKAASGALWNVKDDKEKKEKILTSPQKAKGHVMISYQWADQKKLIQIQTNLSEKGYLVWMDIKDMEGSTLQAMADAVENASVVLVCMSERYKDSSNCRTEAEYAFTLKKPIVPLMMQRGYRPTGWLGMILGAKLFVDFSGKYAYEDSLVKLTKQLGNEGKVSPTAEDIDTVDGPIPVIKSVPLQAARGNTTIQWTPEDVLGWLKKMNLEKNQKLHALTGEQLYFLKKLSNRAPEFFFTYVQKNLGLSDLEDLMRFSNSIDQLS